MPKKNSGEPKDNSGKPKKNKKSKNNAVKKLGKSIGMKMKKAIKKKYLNPLNLIS